MEMLLERTDRKRFFNTPGEAFAHFKREWREIVFVTLPILALAIFLQVYTGRITTALTTGGPVQDVILNMIPPMDLSPYFVWGYIAAITVFGVYVLAVDATRFRQAAFFFSLIVIVRAGFILLTGLRSPEGSLPVLFPGFTGKLQAENDLFFSGHVAIPFMGFLYFRDKRILRSFFLFCSMSLGATALIMHRHYSIDVLAAPFICHGVYVLGGKLYSRIRPLVSPRKPEGATQAAGKESDEMAG